VAGRVADNDISMLRLKCIQMHVTIITKY
jgi:hypothetical protein